MKTRLCTFLLFAFLNVSAQRNGISLEPMVGYGNGSNQRNNSSDFVGPSARIGCGVIYMFNDHFGISSGLQITTNSSSINTSYLDYQSSSDTTYSGTIKYTFTYLELPLLFRYISSKDNKIGFFAESGFNLGFLVSSNESGTISQDISSYSIINGSTTTSSTELLNGTSPGASVFNLSAYLALGIFIPLSQKCSLVIDGAINYGLTSAGNGNGDVVLFNNLSVPYYYYNNNGIIQGFSNSASSSSNYGNYANWLVCLRLNIKLGGNPPTSQPN